jgi:3-dehydroquinate synthetase
MPDTADLATRMQAKASDAAKSLLLADPDSDLRLESTLRRSQQVRHTSGVFDLDNPVLREAVGGRSALVVCTPTVYRLYGAGIRDYAATLSTPSSVEIMVLDRDESSKSLDAVVEVCERAAASRLLRTSPIIAVGGGVCTDICGLAAALYRRGIPHIKIPTTLVGLVDAGIGTKNAVNHGGHKSSLGSFHPPEHSILDPGFLTTLPVRHLRNGLAEIAKLAIVAEPALFELLARHGVDLLRSGFRAPAGARDEVLHRSVAGMLGQLSENLFEQVDYRRKVDFGHTLSPYIEIASEHAVLHGEAVAMDVALSSQIAHDLGVLDAGHLDRILSLLSGLGLNLVWAPTQVDLMWSTLSTVHEHRNGDLHLVVPTGIGSCTCLGLEAVTPEVLRDAHERLLLRRFSRPPRAAFDDAVSR